MPANWPDSLPTPREVLMEGYAETWPAPALRTDMDAGPAKVRRRTTAIARPIACRMMMTDEQVATFRSFHSGTLDDGALPFTFDLPRNNADILARFASDVSITPAGTGADWIASFTLEWLP